MAQLLAVTNYRELSLFLIRHDAGACFADAISSWFAYLIRNSGASPEKCC